MVHYVAERDRKKNLVMSEKGGARVGAGRPSASGGTLHSYSGHHLARSTISTSLPLAHKAANWPNEREYRQKHRSSWSLILSVPCVPCFLPVHTMVYLHVVPSTSTSCERQYYSMYVIYYDVHTLIHILDLNLVAITAYIVTQCL